MELKILFIDNDRMYLELIQAIFRHARGIDVSCAGSGEEALEEIKERIFDLIITDYHMPGMDGFKLAEGVHEIIPDQPIVMITSEDISQRITELAVKSGVWRVYAKPARLREFLTIIDDTAGLIMEGRS